MAKVTNKPQVAAVRRALAEQTNSVEARLRLFDQATARQRRREARRGRKSPAKSGTGCGWTREELYERGRAR